MRHTTFTLLITLFLATALTAQAQEDKKPEQKIGPLETITDTEEPQNEVQKMIAALQKKGELIVGCRQPCHQNDDGSPSFMNGEAISLPRPVYPPIARGARAQGTVVVQVLIDYDGKVIAAAVLSGHPLLRAASIQAARKSEFGRTTFEGKPVMVAGVLQYNFVAQ
jgi:TonB family protein